MVEANEIRIGLVLHQEGHGPFMVIRDSLVSNAFWEEVINGKIKGIPLSPEILEKCGFKLIVEYSYYEKDGVFLNEDFLLCDTDLHVKMIHLHQLQNLYHSLTGEELDVVL